MFYKKFGESRNFIVFLHGWGSDLNSFLWLKNYFVDDYSLLFLDFDGFGKSDEPVKKMTVSDYVFNLKNLLDKFDIEKLVFVAHSFGGRVAIKFSFFYQNFYKQCSLCLVDSAGLIPKRNLIYKIRVYRYKCLKRKSKNKLTLREKLNKFGSSDYKVLSDVMKQTFVCVVNEDLQKYLKFIVCKTLIVWGDRDRETGLFMAKKFNRYIKNSKLIIFKNSGHFSFVENREEFIIILDSFLKNL